MITLRLHNYNYILLVIILLVSSFTHLWNVAGFPDVFFDEGVYMRRAMHVLNGLGPQEGNFYDHPFFGQIFLAGILGAISYPQSLNPSTDANSISSLYLIPRIIVGLLAVVDTFLIYKIANIRYGSNVALISSALFAIMPITWIFRRILLDSILLPFLLLSILLALYSKDSKHNTLLVLLSGVCLGLAIFTKAPAFTMMALVGSLVFFNNHRRFKMLGLWLIPVIMIPLFWPLQSIESGQFSYWVHDVFYFQTHRVGGADLFAVSKAFGQIDPVLFGLGLAALVYAAIRKDYLILVWFVPFVIFLYLIGYNQYFYWISVIPAMCIASGILIVELSKKITRKKIAKICPVIIVVGLGIFGMINLVQLITTDMSSAEYKAASFVANYNGYDNNTSILASSTYSWIFSDVFHKKNVLLDYSMILFEPLNTSKAILVADPHFIFDLNRGKQLVDIYNSTRTIATFDGNLSKYDTSVYPYQSLFSTYEGSHIEIRVKK